MHTDPLTRPTACPACGAAVLTAVSWCSLCYASLVAVPAVAEAAAVAEAPAAGVSHSADAPTSDVEFEVVAAQMLAELAATRDPEPAWLARRPGSSAAKAGLIAGGVVVGTVVLFVAMTVLGLLL